MDSSSLSQAHSYRLRGRFIGTVRIPLESFQYESESVFGVKSLNPENILRLIRTFELEGCNRSKHAVDATITAAQLKRTLQSLGIEEKEALRDDRERIKFPKEFPVVCIHGKHRLEAGRRFLRNDQLWWDANLWEEGMLNIKI
jgi:hypothetical protein